MPRNPRVPFLVVAMAMASLPQGLLGQGRRASAPADGWPPIEVGVHGGYESPSTGSVLGAQVRIPLHPSGYVELVSTGDVVFLPRLKEYLSGVNLVAVSGGRRGGIYVGGGVTWRNTLYDGARATRRFPTIVAGLRSPELFGSRLGTQLEVRWIRVDTAAKPKVMTLGVNVPLWGRGGRGR